MSTSNVKGEPVAIGNSHADIGMHAHTCVSVCVSIYFLKIIKCAVADTLGHSTIGHPYPLNRQHYLYHSL